MTLIVKNTARLVAGFIAVFGVYVALTGHITPGGGFAGGVILAASGVLLVLAFGKAAVAPVISEGRCHIWDAAAAGAFLLVALCGFFVGAFFGNFLSPGQVHSLHSGGAIPLSNLAILVKVGAGLVGAFIALAAYRRVSNTPANPGRSDDSGPQEA